jgi:hypothetical protein
MGFLSVVYAFVLLILVDGALAQQPWTPILQRPILGDHSQHLYGDTFCEKEGEWMKWTGGWERPGTIVAGNVHGYGCSHYKEDVCATLSYELIDENADDNIDIMLTKGDFCDSSEGLSSHSYFFPLEGQHHFVMQNPESAFFNVVTWGWDPLSSNGTDLGLTASKAFFVLILCNNENHACDKIKFRMKIATHKIGTRGCQAAAAVISSQGDAAVSSSASTNLLLTVFLTIISVASLKKYIHFFRV